MKQQAYSISPSTGPQNQRNESPEEQPETDRHEAPVPSLREFITIVVADPRHPSWHFQRGVSSNYSEVATRQDLCTILQSALDILDDDCDGF